MNIGTTVAFCPLETVTSSSVPAVEADSLQTMHSSVTLPADVPAEAFYCVYTPFNPSGNDAT